MRDQVLWRKTARIIMDLAKRLDISPEMAMDLLYNSETYAFLTNSESGLNLMSDEYIVNDIITELQNQ